jgi:anti-sigma factor RsiW
VKEIACMSGVELLMEYLEGELPADLRQALDDHVAGCDRCAAFVASYLQTPRILRDATGAALPLELEASLKAFLRARTGAFRSS